MKVDEILEKKVEENIEESKITAHFGSCPIDDCGFQTKKAKSRKKAIFHLKSHLRDKHLDEIMEEEVDEKQE